MKRFNVITGMLAMILIFGMSSCKKEKGCTDMKSPTYNADAEKDDGSCQSTGDVFAGSWNVSETVNFDNTIQEVYDVTITKVNDSTLTITSDRTNLPIYGVETLEVAVSWLDKDMEGTNNNNSVAQAIEGTVTNTNQFNIQYEVWNFEDVDSVYLSITR